VFKVVVVVVVGVVVVVVEHTKRKLSAGSPSAKLAGVEKAPKIDEAKSISAPTVGVA